MNIFFKSLLIVLLVLIQVNFLPLNLAFTFVVGLGLFTEKLSYFGWLILVAFLLFVLSAANFGEILLSITLAFLTIQFIRQFVPNNYLSKTLLLIISLPLAEIAFKFVHGVFK